MICVQRKITSVWLFILADWLTWQYKWQDKLAWRSPVIRDQTTSDHRWKGDFSDADESQIWPWICDNYGILCIQNCSSNDAENDTHASETGLHKVQMVLS